MAFIILISTLMLAIVAYSLHRYRKTGRKKYVYDLAIYMVAFVTFVAFIIWRAAK